ncbi:MAG: DUF1844 domain-containing protein [Candidatus Omnitrophota bacterium]|nr:DUF1844 domain-containing protein [Candidatus Omnitrophota bacterium]
MIEENKKKVDNTWKESVDKEKEKGRENAQPPQEMNFGMFITSLGMQVLIHLGEITNPLTKKKEQDLTQAKQTINLIVMLKDKTKGNLEKDETALLENLLYELRMKYIERTK